jgi:tRNA A37 methylthiotransferase MiaB
MPIFDGSLQDNQDAGIYYEPVNLRNLSLYQQQHGKERAEGYRDCMFDLLKKVDLILDQPLDAVSCYENSPAQVRKHLRKLFEDQKIIYRTLDSNLQSSDPNVSLSDDITKLTL